jgi:glycosyltransferase involved in cell wall biosynthesis
MNTQEKQIPKWLKKLYGKYKHHWAAWCSDPVSMNDRKHFGQLAAEHDLVWFHSFYAADCLRKYRIPRSIMDMDDLNYIKYQLKADCAPEIRQRFSDKVVSCKWKQRETGVLDRFTLACVCSEADKNLLGGSDRIHVIPNGFKKPAEKPVFGERNPLRLGFIGALSYFPNEDGLKWFGREVWPKILNQIPQARFRIIGRLPKIAAFLDQPGFEPLDYIEDPTEEIASWSAMVVPLRFGGGTRLKIVEGFSRMCPMVSTPLGAYGIDVTDGKDILLAEQPDNFKEKCIQLLNQPMLGLRLAENGWSLYLKKYTWDVISEAVQATVSDCLEQSRIKQDII